MTRAAFLGWSPLLLGVLASTVSVASGQDTQVVQTNERITIRSVILNEERSVLVRVPPGYAQGSEKYPVVYLLDANSQRINLMTGTIENLVDSNFAPEMILVAIPNTIRPRDMTPSRIATMPASGGADQFLRFIETEVMPEVARRYRIRPYNIIVGHSLSGLLVSYAFVSRPELFNAYLAASPAYLQWDDNLIVRRGEKSLKPRKELNRVLFFALGDEPEFLGGFNRFKQMLDRPQVAKLDYEMRQIPGENHWSTNADVFNKGLRKVWHAWQAPKPALDTDLSLRELESHYRAASTRYGYDIAIPESVLNPLGFRLLQRNKIDDAVRVLEKSVELYPRSANANNTLASAFEKNGQIPKAKVFYQKALKLAEAGGNARFAESIRESVKRVSQPQIPQ